VKESNSKISSDQGLARTEGGGVKGKNIGEGKGASGTNIVRSKSLGQRKTGTTCWGRANNMTGNLAESQGKAGELISVCGGAGESKKKFSPTRENPSSSSGEAQSKTMQ